MALSRAPGGGGGASSPIARLTRSRVAPASGRAFKAGDQPEFIVSKRFLRMQVGVLDQAEDLLRSRITAELNAQSVKYTSKALNPRVFSGSYYSAGLDQSLLSPAGIPGS